ncbi:MAG: hypothetical protein LBQ61_06970 [Spirochaetales bacterium]|jgi:hypothetical protein|nr:hypothetical protein [Spirochaetales bacterium]
MKKILSIAVLAGLLLNFAAAQSNPALVEAFQRNFTRGSLSAKIEVLQDSLNYPETDWSSLYLLSLDFVTRNISILLNDNLARELTNLTIRLIRLSGEEGASGRPPGGNPAEALWSLFNVYGDISIQQEILSTLAVIAHREPRILENLNRWAEGRNNLYRAGQPVNLDLLGEAFVTLGKIGDESSFPILFAASTIAYPQEVKQKAEDALRQVVAEDYRQMVGAILQNSPLPEKIAVLDYVAGESKIPEGDKAWIARRALQTGLVLSPQSTEEQSRIFEFQNRAAILLTSYPAPEGANDLVRHFDTLLLAIDRGLAPAGYLINAIEALGRSGAREAAERLTLYLELVNLYTENGQTVDPGVVMAVIHSLSLLGDRISFDYLLYVRYLSYPEEIKEAAREALDNLKRD